VAASIRHDPRALRSVIGVCCSLRHAGGITPNEAMVVLVYHAARRATIRLTGRVWAKRKAQFHELSTGQQRRLALALPSPTPRVIFLTNRQPA
jgi:hypothetical protein